MAIRILNTRSPFWVNVTGADLGLVSFTVIVTPITENPTTYSGIPVTLGQSTNYVVGSGGTNRIAVDVSSHLRSLFVGSTLYEPRYYVQFSVSRFNTSGSYLSGGITDIFLVMDGWGDYSDSLETVASETFGYTDSNYTGFRITPFYRLFSAEKFYVKEGADLNVEFMVRTDSTAVLKAYSNGSEIFSQTNSSGSYSPYVKFSSINSASYPMDQISITTGGVTYYHDVELVCEPKYEQKQVKFVNRYGANEWIWFNKKTTESLNVSSDSYKSNYFDVLTSSFDNKNAEYDRININSNETIQMNTGFITELNTNLIKDLLLSEKAWLVEGESLIPINVVSSSAQYKTHLNDNLINYTIDFEYAFDKINSIG